MHRRDSLSAAYLMVLSALPHLPASIRLHCTIGVSEQVRDFWRTMDVFMIFTCAGAGRGAFCLQGGNVG